MKRIGATSRLSPLHCCSFLLLLVLVAAEIEYYPDFDGASSSSDEIESHHQATRFQRLLRLLQRRSHHYEPQEQQEQVDEEDEDEEIAEEQARRQWSSRILEQSLAIERQRLQRELAERQLLREQGEILERPESLERHEMLLQQRLMQRLRDYQVRRQHQQQQQQQQQRLQELDYPEVSGDERNRVEFTYSLAPVISRTATQRPFAVGPNDRRFHANEEWNRDDDDDDDDNVEPEATTTTTTTTTTMRTTTASASHRVSTPHLQLKVEQRRASIGQREMAADNLANELQVISLRQKLSQEDVYVIALVAGCSAALMFALVLMSLLWCRLHRVSKAAKDVDYPAYGVTGPNKDLSPSSAADQRLAQSAQMYHFQHQKQQIIAMEKASTAAGREPGSVSEAESDEENDEGDYTVYECPGLAPTGEMEVKNPLFHDEPTPQTPAKSKNEYTTDEDDL